jgi:PPM family protein phosphatase
MEQRFTFETGEATHPGQKRSVNEDALLPWVPADPHQLHERGALFVVADGMGAYGHGAVAAEKVMQYVKDNYYHAGQPIRQAVEQANVQIYQFAQDHPENEGMGTTIVGLVGYPDGRFQAFNVGDSRAYLVRNGQIAQLSHDHSVVARRVEQEGLSWSEAVKRGKTNQLTRSIGRKPAVEVEVKPVEQFGPGDVFLLCSDGLWRDVSSDELQQCLTAAATAQDAATQLVNLSNSRGGADNITALVVRCVEPGAQKLTTMPAWATTPASFDDPLAPAKAVSKSPAGKPDARLIYGLLGLGVFAVLTLVLILSLPGKSSPAATDVSVSVSTAEAATAVAVAANSDTPTPAASDFKYGSQLEIVGDSDARFPKDQAVTLEWKSPPGVTALAANEVYVVRVTYQDANGHSQTISLTAATTRIALPRATFFVDDQPVAAKGTPYQWTVAVAERLADQTFKEISPPTKPPYAFYWMANPPPVLPPATTTREAQPGSTPALDGITPTPVCPSGKFYDPVMKRCRGTAGPGPASTSEPGPVDPPVPIAP